MKTTRLKRNILFTTLCILSFIASCKKKSEDIKPTEPETTTAPATLIFKPRIVYISTDSTNFGLQNVYEYDELGRIKTKYVYSDRNLTNLGITFFKTESKYFKKLVYNRTVEYNFYIKKYGFTSWDSLFYDDNNRLLKEKHLNIYQSNVGLENDTIGGAKTNIDYTYATVGDTSLVTKKGVRYNEPYNESNYFDKSGILVKVVDSNPHTSVLNTYTIANEGSFFDSQMFDDFVVMGNKKLLSKYDISIFGNNEFTYSKKCNLNWAFDTSGKPISLTLSQNLNGVSSSTFYRFEY